MGKKVNIIKAKNRPLKIALSSALTLLFPIPFTLADTNCPSIDSLSPRYDSRQIGNNCAEDQECNGALRVFEEHRVSVQNRIRESCRQANSILQQANSVGAQREALQRAQNAIASGRTQITSVLQTIDEAKRNVRHALQQVIQREQQQSGTPATASLAVPPAPSDQSEVRLHNSLLADEARLRRESDIQGEPVAQNRNAKQFARRNGMRLLQALTRARDDREQKLRELEQASSTISGRIDNIGTASGPSSSGSGLNTQGLMGLGTALTGLAGALQQQRGSPSSSTPPLSTPPGSATSPTPDSSNGPQVSKLEGEGLGSSSGNAPKFETAKPKSKETAIPSGGSDFGAASGAFSSDISKTALAPSTNTSGSKPGGSGASSSGGIGSSSAAAKDIGAGSSAAAANPAKEEDLSAFAGGNMGGGGGFGGGSRGPSADAGLDMPALDSGTGIKDIFNDLRETANDAPLQGASGVGEMNGEDLFPRVHACIVRSLKKGFVINGLGEQIPQ